MKKVELKKIIREEVKSLTEGSNLTAYVLYIGNITISSGKTKYGWSIYDPPTTHLFLTRNGRLLYATKDTFKKGDVVTLRDNDSHRKITEAIIKDDCPAEKDKLLKMLKKNGYDYYPLKPFQKRNNRNKLSGSYSVKGTELNK